MSHDRLCHHTTNQYSLQTSNEMKNDGSKHFNHVNNILDCQKKLTEDNQDKNIRNNQRSSCIYSSLFSGFKINRMGKSSVFAKLRHDASVLYDYPQANPPSQLNLQSFVSKSSSNEATQAVVNEAVIALRRCDDTVKKNYINRMLKEQFNQNRYIHYNSTGRFPVANLGKENFCQVSLNESANHGYSQRRVDTYSDQKTLWEYSGKGNSTLPKKKRPYTIDQFQMDMSAQRSLSNRKILRR